MRILFTFVKKQILGEYIYFKKDKDAFLKVKFVTDRNISF